MLEAINRLNIPGGDLSVPPRPPGCAAWRMCRLGLTLAWFCALASLSCGIDALTRLPWILRALFCLADATALTLVCVSLSTFFGFDDVVGSSGIDGKADLAVDMPVWLALCSALAP